jgi:photosystem II stability/assembly factor-like uncharacterized protein
VTWALLFLFGIAFGISPPLAAEHRLYGCGQTSKGWVVGAKLKPSGLFLHTGQDWERLGPLHPAVITLDYDPREPRRIYLAAGNGCIRSEDGGRSWRIMTGWEMTELQDVSVDANQPDSVWIALPDGVAVSRDRGVTWSRTDLGVKRKYTQSIRVDRAHRGRVLAGSERGVLLTEDDGRSWRLAGVAQGMITHLEQSPHDPRQWIATTQEHGAYLSSDSGLSWKRLDGVPAGTLYNASFDPTTKGRIAIAGWQTGVAVSEDGGRLWKDRSSGLPSRNIWRAVFDPDHPGAIYASVHEEAVYLSPDAGLSWNQAGIDGSIIFDFVFVPERRP